MIDGRKRIFYEPMVIGENSASSNERTIDRSEIVVLGPVEIHISKGNQPIAGSPLIVQAFDPTAVRLVDCPEKVLVNTTNRLIIDPTEAGKGSLKISVKGSFGVVSSERSTIFLFGRSEQSFGADHRSQTIEWTRRR